MIFRHSRFARIACAALTIATFTCSSSALARERPDLPGRAPRHVERMIIFSVSSNTEGKKLHGASISCEFGRIRQQKRTDWTGTAPLAFSYERYPIGRAQRVECQISKIGYLSDHRKLDLADGPASRLIRVDLVPR